MTLNGHDDVVKSLMCWDMYLFSGSLDCTIKFGLLLRMAAWKCATVVELCYYWFGKGKLYCYVKNSIGKGKIGPAGLFFIRDQTGLLTVYTWLAD
ncbi:hypothetical protein CFP56_010070 [Quercus suber]|uniref:Uncharacterized protein n=1 Tax=Quercus suber TaxID=58331 RepID=A0AAW0KZT3_QUESU